MKTKEQKNKRHPVLITMLGLLLVLAAVCGVFTRFGGFGTGECSDIAEFAKYAEQVSDINIPDGTRIIALGEATHGNKEFQQLKLDVLRLTVEKYGVRAFALEADTGGCEAVDRYIHGGAGTAKEAVSALMFHIYQTDDMAALIEWMREYNDHAAEGEDLRFYGFDMQSCDYSFKFLLETVKALGIDSTELEKLTDGSELSDNYSQNEREQIYNGIKDSLTALRGEEYDRDVEFAIHNAEMLIQNCELGKVAGNSAAAIPLRDRYMAENTLWLLGQEEQRGHGRLFISGHSGHVGQKGDNAGGGRIMGAIVAEEIGTDAYFAIGTDFYKTVCNLPDMPSGKRHNRTFYSYDPLAKAAYKNGYDRCWLDFSEVPEDSPLYGQINGYIYLGTLGEGYSIITRLLPYAYREWRMPSEPYDGMIYVPLAGPIVIKEQ